MTPLEHAKKAVEIAWKQAKKYHELAWEFADDPGRNEIMSSVSRAAFQVHLAACAVLKAIEDAESKQDDQDPRYTTLRVATVNPENYTLHNTADGTTWRGTKDGEWKAVEVAPEPEAEPAETLRDRFALQAMEGFISGHMAKYGHDGYWQRPAVAEEAYVMADAMLEARKK